MDIQNKEVNYKFLLTAGETLKLDINGVKQYEVTVSPDTQGRLTFKFQESMIEE